MKKTMFTLLFILFSTVSFAAPFLISDPSTSVVKYRVRLSMDNGQTWGPWGESAPDPTGALKVDLQSLTPANYKGEVQAYGVNISVVDSTTGYTSTTMGVWTPSAPFVLNVMTLNTPKNIRVTGN